MTAANTDARAARFAEAARRYSELGWALVRLNGKVPRGREWQKEKPRRPDVAAGEWAQYGQRLDMGVQLSGSLPPLAVVEPDTPEARAVLLELLGGELPDVPIVESGGKSLHTYWLDGGQGNASVDGLELRAGAQQCVVPPSVHPDTGRTYRWLPGHAPWEVALVPIPEELLAYFAGTLFAPKRAEPVGDEILEKNPGRHKTLLSLAGSMRHRGMSGDEIAVALLVVNERRCKPPLPESEVVELARDVAHRYEPAPPDVEQERIGRVADELLAAPRANQEQPEEEASSGTRPRRKRALLQRPLSSVTARPTEWLVPQIVPLGTLTLVAGVGGLGKSGLLLAWAAPVTREGHVVLIVSYEDAAEQVIRPRFEALNGDLTRLRELYVDPLDGSVSFPVDLPDLERIVADSKARMVLIDPVSASIDTKLDSHRDRDMRVVLGQLAKLAERHELAGVLNAHLNKAPSSDPYLRINGSTAFYNAARSVLTVTEDPMDKDTQRLVAHHKSNYGRLATVQRWKVEIVEVATPSGPIQTARMVYVEDADDVERADVLGVPGTADKRTEAAMLIMAELAFGRRLSSDVKAAGMRQGISPATVKRAAQDVEVVIEEETTEQGRVTYWSLQEGSDHPPPHESEPTPPEAHNQAEEGGSAQISDVGDEPTLEGDL